MDDLMRLKQSLELAKSLFCELYGEAINLRDRDYNEVMLYQIISNLEIAITNLESQS